MLRCGPEAFAKCPTRALCGNVHEATFTEGSECDRFNRSVVDKPMTNADRFRSMGDEELVALARKQIGGGFDWFPCGAVCNGKCESFTDEQCHDKILKWLQQPLETRK